MSRIIYSRRDAVSDPIVLSRLDQKKILPLRFQRLCGENSILEWSQIEKEYDQEGANGRAGLYRIA
jgi:hypothetical protein